MLGDLICITRTKKEETDNTRAGGRGRLGAFYNRRQGVL